MSLDPLSVVNRMSYLGSQLSMARPNQPTRLPVSHDRQADENRVSSVQMLHWHRSQLTDCLTANDWQILTTQVVFLPTRIRSAVPA